MSKTRRHKLKNNRYGALPLVNWFKTVFLQPKRKNRKIKSKSRVENDDSDVSVGEVNAAAPSRAQAKQENGTVPGGDAEVVSWLVNYLLTCGHVTIECKIYILPRFRCYLALSQALKFLWKRMTIFVNWQSR